MFCITQEQFFFWGGGCKNAQAVYSMQANPTERRALQCISVGGQTGTCVSQETRQLHTGGHLVETSCRFDLCLTEVADRATVQQPPNADRKPRVL